MAIDPVTVSTLVGMVGLLIMQTFTFLDKIKRSKCCGNTVEFEDTTLPPATAIPK